MDSLSKQVHPRKITLSRLTTFLCVLTLAGVPSASANTGGSQKLSDLLELRGYTRIGGALEFSVYNKAEKRSEWLRVDEEQQGYRIESYDSERNEILIHYNGLQGTLPLQASQISDYVEPVPTRGNPESKAPSEAVRPPRAPQEATANRTGNARRLSPQSRSANTGGSSRERSTESQNFLAGRGSRPVPPANDPPPTGEQAKPNDPDSGGSYWESMDSPPPVPSSVPPTYSPEE